MYCILAIVSILRALSCAVHYEAPASGAAMTTDSELASVRRRHAEEVAELAAMHEKERVMWDRDRKYLTFLLNATDSRRSAAESEAHEALHQCSHNLRKPREFCAHMAAKLAEAQDAAGVRNHTLQLHDAALRAHCALPDAPPR